MSDRCRGTERISQTERELRKQVYQLKQKQKRKKMSGLDKYLVFSFAVILIYTVVQTIITAKTGVELTTLTTCFFAVFGGEVLACALIKKMKLENESEKKESEVENDEVVG